MRGSFAEEGVQDNRRRASFVTLLRHLYISTLKCKSATNRKHIFSLSVSLSFAALLRLLYISTRSVNLQQTENTFPLSIFLSPLSLSPLSPCYAFYTFLHWSVNQQQAEYTGAGRPDFCHGSLQKIKARKNYLCVYTTSAHTNVLALHRDFSCEVLRCAAPAWQPFSRIWLRHAWACTASGYFSRTWFKCSHMVVKTPLYCTRKCGCKVLHISTLHKKNLCAMRAQRCKWICRKISQNGWSHAFTELYIDIYDAHVSTCIICIDVALTLLWFSNTHTCMYLTAQFCT